MKNNLIVVTGYFGAPIEETARKIAEDKAFALVSLDEEIAKRGGVVGINYYGPQLTKNGTATIDDIVRHIVHAVEIGGIDAVCLGSDFDGMTRYPVDLPNPSKLQDLCKALERAGFTPNEVQKIAYQNLHDYIVQFV